jgi:hypothetical protein
MEENQNLLLRCLTVVVYVEELDDIFENSIFVEYVLEKRLTLEN